MYDMYPAGWSVAMSERGEAGIGHPDYPVESRKKPLSPEVADAMQPSPDMHTILSPRAEHLLGYVGVKDMVNE